MSILDVPPPGRVFSIRVAEHPRHLVRAYQAPGRVVWFVIRPERHFRVVAMHGYKTAGAVVVTFRF